MKLKNAIQLQGKLTSAIKLTQAQADLLGFTSQTGNIRGNIKTFGAWQIPVSFNALCVSCQFAEPYQGYSYESFTIHGARTLVKLKSCGYEMEGRVSVNGKTVRGFTSSQIFELPCGHLINVSVIYACLNQ